MERRKRKNEGGEGQREDGKTSGTTNHLEFILLLAIFFSLVQVVRLKFLFDKKLLEECIRIPIESSSFRKRKEALEAKFVHFQQEDEEECDRSSVTKSGSYNNSNSSNNNDSNNDHDNSDMTDHDSYLQTDGGVSVHEFELEQEQEEQHNQYMYFIEE